MSGVLELPARRFTEATGVLLALATGLLGLGLERLIRGSTPFAVALLGVGGLATVLAFTLKVEDDPSRETLMLVTREECAHCDEARAILRGLQEDYGFSVWEVDVNEDEAMAEQWTDEVPVLVHDGHKVASLEVRPEHVEAALQTSQKRNENG